MKTIIYLLIVLMVGSIVYSAIPRTARAVKMFQNEVILESNGKILSENELSASIEIISKRLEDYGIKLFNIYAITEKSQIGINFKKRQNIVEIADLLCRKGKLLFLETYSSTEVLKQIGEDDKLFSFIDAGILDENGVYNAELGYCKQKDTENLSVYINSASFRERIPADAIFAWGKSTEEKPNEFPLFSLRFDDEKIAFLNGSAVSEIKLDVSNADMLSVLIKFNEEGAIVWQNMTLKNINRAIAIVLDQQVYYAPIVRSEIKGGSCVLSGNFTKNELKVFVAMVKNGELPNSFKIK